MKEKKYILSSLLLLALIFISFSPLIAAEKDVNERKTDKIPISLSVDYFYPVEKSRNIDTINFNAYYPIKEFNKIGLILYGELTCTFASGDITQLEGEFSEGTLHEVNYDNEAFGIGPGLWTDFSVLNGDTISFHIGGGGNFIAYNKNFPAGGDRYNFMWRAGPMLKIHIGNKRNIGIGYLWMHVSNGQGAGPQNPSYEAQGISVYFSSAF